MSSLLDPRYCEMGERCVSYDNERRRATKLSRYSNDDICGACRERQLDAQVVPSATQREQTAPLNSQPAPEEYRELFRAARVLFEAGVEEEELIIPTLAFAVYSWEKPGVAYLRDKLSKVDEGGEAWEDLRQVFFLNTFNTLEPETVIDGVLVVRHVPLYVTLTPFDPRKAKTQPVEKIIIDVLSRPVKADDVVRKYERALQIGEISYERSDKGSVSYKAYKDYIRLIVRPEDLAGADAMDGALLDFRRAGGKWEQLPFPPPLIVGSMYEGAIRRFGDEALRGRERGTRFKHHNLIPACVAWYVGKRGGLIENTKLRDEVVSALDMHLFAPLGKEVLGSKSSNAARQLWSAVNNMSQSQLIQRTDEELQDPHTWTRFSFNLSG